MSITNSCNPVLSRAILFFFVLLALMRTASAADYMVFAGAHSGTIYAEEIAGQTLDDDDHPAFGYDGLFLFGEQTWGFGITYTYTSHKMNLEGTGIELKQVYSGPGVVFGSLIVSEGGSKTGIYIGVESLGLTSEAKKCGANVSICNDLTERLDGQRASTLTVGIVGTASNGLGLGFNARAFRFEEMEKSYQVNLLFGFGF